MLHPGAGGRRKRWPAERFAEIARRLAGRGCAIAVTQGAADEDAVATLCRALGNVPVRILADLALPDLATELAEASLFVGNDSGITHLAAMLGIPTLAIFGPYDPVYWSPIGPQIAVVDAGRGCPHRADPREGCRQCDLMPTVEVEPVWRAVDALRERAEGASA